MSSAPFLAGVGAPASRRLAAFARRPSSMTGVMVPGYPLTERSSPAVFARSGQDDQVVAMHDLVR